MMTLSMPSAVYCQNNANASFTDLNSGSNQVNNSHQSQQTNLKDSIHYRVSNPNSCGSQSFNVPTANLNAAISSSLKLNKHIHGISKAEDYSVDLLGRNISFHRSSAESLDVLVKTRVEGMPNSLILTNPKNENIEVSSENGKCLLFSDADLLKCCQQSQASLPRCNLGLRNAGNTCYLNSVLQCLLATGSLLNYVSENHNRPGACVYANGKIVRRFCALCATHKLLQEHGINSQSGQSMQNGSGVFFNTTHIGSTTPSYFVDNVRAICPNLRAYQQEDAHEFLLGVLSRMEDSVMAVHGKVPRCTMETNVIRRIFGGTTRSEVTCSTCRKVSPKNDSWFNLSLDITFARSLQQCLVNYTQPEILHNANAYKCETCNKLRHASRCCRIFRPPPVLVVQFNRFSRNHKLDTRIDFPASFNMRPHMTPAHGPAVIYNLYATLNHEGFSCRSGHYIAFTKRRNQWFSHNDSCVTSTTQEYVLRQSPYLLFYELASPELVISNRGSASKLNTENRQIPSIANQLPHRSASVTPSKPSTSNPLAGVSIHQPSKPVDKPAIVFHPRVLCKPLSIGDFEHKTANSASHVEKKSHAVVTSSPAATPFVGTSTPTPNLPRRLPLTSLISVPIPVTMSIPISADPSHTLTCNPADTVNGFEKGRRHSRTSSVSSDVESATSSGSSSNSSSSVVWVPLTKTDLEAPTPVRKRKLEEAAATATKHDSSMDRKKRRKDRKDRKKRKERHRRDSKHRNRKHKKRNSQAGEK